MTWQKLIRWVTGDPNDWRKPGVFVMTGKNVEELRWPPEWTKK